MKTTRSEASIEHAVCDRAFKKLGVLNKKMNGPGARSWPDRLFMWKPKQTLFIEFKKPGEDATPLQKNNHAALRFLGFQVEVCDDVDAAMALLEAAVERSKRRG